MDIYEKARNMGLISRHIDQLNLANAQYMQAKFNAVKYHDIGLDMAADRTPDPYKRIQETIIFKNLLWDLTDREDCLGRRLFPPQ